MKPAQLRLRRPTKPAQEKTNKEMAEIFKSLADEKQYPRTQGGASVERP